MRSLNDADTIALSQCECDRTAYRCCHIVGCVVAELLFGAGADGARGGGSRRAVCTGTEEALSLAVRPRIQQQPQARRHARRDRRLPASVRPEIAALHLRRNGPVHQYRVDRRRRVRQNLLRRGPSAAECRAHVRQHQERLQRLPRNRRSAAKRRGAEVVHQPLPAPRLRQLVRGRARHLPELRHRGRHGVRRSRSRHPGRRSVQVGRHRRRRLLRFARQRVQAQRRAGC